jgi:hypothetical protein
VRVTPDFLLSELLAPQGGSSLGRATTKLLFFFFTFFQMDYMYLFFLHGDPSRYKSSHRLVYGLALPALSPKWWVILELVGNHQNGGDCSNVAFSANFSKMESVTWMLYGTTPLFLIFFLG